MKILVADRISPKGVAWLKEQDGFDVVEAYGSSPEQVLELVSDVEAIIVRSETKVTREVMEAAPKLKAVGRAGVGVDNIDVDAATERGVIVMNTPSGNTIATAELTFTHMLCGTRPVAQANASCKAGKWNRKAFSGVELRGKTLGVLGFGRIGSEVAKRAQAFEMDVLAYDPFLTEERAKSMDVQLADLNELFEKSDYITVHMPLTDKTKHMVNAEAFAKMKDGVRIFNCARGGIIDEAALIDACKSGKVAAAGLDVYENESVVSKNLNESPLVAIDSIVMTPHLGASTEEAQESVGIEVAECIGAALKGETIRNALNMPSVDARTLKILAPYLNLGEKLGAIIQQITPDKIEKLRISYTGKIVDLDAMPLSRAIQRGYLLNISGSEVNDVNAPMLIKRLGVEVEVVKSNLEGDFKDLVQVEAICPGGEAHSIAGTLIGVSHSPRIVNLDGHSLEIAPENTLLILTNKDVPGIIGHVGTLLGEAGVNIANLSLSRNRKGETAFSVFELDSVPSDEAVSTLTSNDNIEDVKIVTL